MRKLVAMAVGILFAGILAGQAFAANGTGGYIELCKAPNAALTGSAQFTIADAVGTSTVAVAVGTCTQPLPVAPGSVTVTENGMLTGLTNAGAVSTTPTTAFVSATITAVGPSGPLTPATGFAYTTTVPASPNGSTNVVTVTYTDTLVTGLVEVCKQIVTGSGLTGNYTFTVTGGNGFTSTVSVPVGACSTPITVPAGLVMVRETGDLAEAVTAITATQTGANTNAIVGPNAGPAADLPTATVVAAVTAGDASRQTIVTYTNNSVRLKLCKYVDQGLTNLGPYPFALTSTGNAGPTAVPATVSLTAGTSFAGAVCTVVGTFRAGTTVTITEGIVPGTKVGSITTSPDDEPRRRPTVVPGSLSLANRTVAVVLGAGETVVTYEDIPALPGTLKLCKAATAVPPLIPAGTLFSFTLAPVAPTTGATRRSVFRRARASSLARSRSTRRGRSPRPRCRTSPWSDHRCADQRRRDRGGAATNTNQLVAVRARTSASRSTNVTIGENNITEVTFTNQDPPEGSTAGGSLTGGSSTGGSSTGGSSTGGSTAASTGGGGATSGGSTAASTGGGGSVAASLTPPTVAGTGIVVGATTVAAPPAP